MPSRRDSSAAESIDQLRQYQDLVETSQDLIWRSDAQGRYTYLNPAWETTFGYKTEEMLGRRFSDFQSPETAERDMQEFTRLMQGGTVKGYETVCIGKSGNRIHVAVTAKRLCDDNGNPIGARGTLHDITGPKQAEEALERSETLFSSTFRMSPAATILSRLQDGMCIDANAAYAHLVGFSREELLGRTTNELKIWMSPDERDHVIHELSQSARLRNVPITLRKKDGSLCSTMASGEIISIEGKQCILSFFYDITERKQAEAALRESEERFRKIVEEAPIPMAVVSRDGVIEFINHKAVQVFGYLPEDIPNMDRWWVQAYPDEDYRKEVVATWTGLVQKAVTEGREIPGNEYRVTCKDGTIKTMVISGAYISHKLFVLFDDFSERKRAEELLRQSNEKFSKIFMTSPDPVTISRFSDGTFLDVNQGFADATGFAREEILGRSSLPGGVALWINEADRNQMVSALKTRGEVIGMEAHMRTKSGAISIALLSARIVEIANEKCILTIARDITARKRMEEALHESEQHYRMVSELAADYVYKLGVAADGQGTMDFVSDNFYSLTGRRKEDARTADLWSSIIHPDDLGKAMGLLRRVVAAPQSVEIECRSYIHGHKLRWVNVIARSEWDEREKRVTAIVGAVKDISERKRAEAAIAAEKERLAVTLRSIGDGVITTDMKGTIVVMNRVAEELTGWTQSEAEGKPLEAVFANVDELTREPCEDPVKRVFSTGRIIELATHALLTSRDGSERIIADSAAPITDRDGKTIGLVLVFRDMTEKRRVQDAMQRAARLDSLGVLAGGIAHDFNNLLTGLFGYVELARSVSKDARAIEYLDATLATMNRARALTLQLLTFAKGGAPVQKVVPLVPFLQETVGFALSGANVACQFSLAKDVWPCNIDRNQIAQVIDNIVINAQQAMPNGGTIEIAASNVSAEEGEYPSLAKGRYVRVSIKDQGIGIPKDVMPRIFDPFYTTKTKGHGLGLATCHSIISRHGGRIDVESEPGRGSTFHVYLPTSTEAAVGDAARIVRQKGSGRVIVVDDEEVVRNTVRRMVESLGYTVVCRKDGKEAIDFYIRETKAGRRFVAMILDLTVRGGMGGKEAVAEIRKLDKELPVFVASGYADDPVMKNPMEYGFTGSIGKPFTITELSDMLVMPAEMLILEG